MRVAVKVTARDIKLGTEATLNSCPLGRAIKRALGLRGRKADGLIIDIETVEYTLDDIAEDVILAKLPRAVIEWLECWDGYEGAEVKPFSFNLNIRNKAAVKAGIVLS